MIDLPRPPAILGILEEHLSELDFLWEQRERFVLSPEWTLKELATLEGRAEAHLDGLRIGAGHSVDIARPFLTADETGAATAATFVLMAFDFHDLDQEVLQALKTAPPKSRDGVRIGLRHSDVKRIAAELSDTALSAAPAVRAAALDVLAFHRLPPPRSIADLFRDPDLSIRRIVCEAVGRFGGPWGADPLWDALESDAPANRVAALRASARLGLPGLDATCREAATRASNPIPEALTFLGVVGGAKDLLILQNATTRPGLADAALAGIGKLGVIAAIPTLLDAMTDDKLTHATGRAFVRITGATNIEANEPIPPPSNLTEDEIDLWDTALPPDPTKARAWWEKEKARFTIEGRWQSGREVSKTPLGEHFNLLPLETRFDLYLGVRARDPQRTPDRELERPAKAQLGGA